ncbi:MAG: DUF3344 domain-containing protein [Chloroflexi bacterium]|nr:DUF3344 domain-containing protein [Chloroflexota bacterium]
MSTKYIVLKRKYFHLISRITWIVMILFLGVQVTSWMLMTLFSGVQVASATDYPGYDGALQKRGSTLTGTYDIVVGGVGMRDLTSNSVNLTVPGDSVVAAYLYWSGIGLDGAQTGDDAVTFQVDADPPQAIVADDTYGPSYWNNRNGQDRYHYVYVEDVTTLVQTGMHQYTLSDYAMPADGMNYGFGLLVVYNNPALTEVSIQILDGLDSLFWRRSAPQDSPSAINCVTFTVHTTSTRVMDVSFFASGVDDTNRPRPNNLYYQTGNGVLPTSIVPTGTVINNPFSSNDGFEWDTYSDRINVEVNDTYACFQAESVSIDEDPPNGPVGASILWMMGSFSLRQETPTTVGLQDVTANNQITPAPLIGFTVLLLVLVTGYILYRKRTGLH